MSQQHNKEKDSYMKVQKALYGMMKSALLFYQKLRDYLEQEGFKVNPYDHVWQTNK